MISPVVNTPYAQLAAALAGTSSSLHGQNRLGSLGEQATAWPVTPIALIPSLYAPSISFDKAVEPAAVLAPARSSVPVQSVAMQALLNGVESDLREARNEIRRRVDRSFYVSLGLGVLGGLALLTGVGLAFAGTVPIGITSGIGGAISGIFSGIFSRLYNTESSELRRLIGDLRRIEEARIGLWLADQIQDQAQRDAAVRELIAQIKRTADT